MKHSIETSNFTSQFGVSYLNGVHCMYSISSVFHMLDELLYLNDFLQKDSLFQGKYSQLVFLRHLISGGTAIYKCMLHHKLFYKLHSLIFPH